MSTVGGGGVPHLPSIILPTTGPCPSWDGGTPSPSHNTFTGPMFFLEAGGTPVPGRGYPGTGWSAPYPGLDGVPPPPCPQERLCLDMLCHGWYASCRFPQEDFLILFCSYLHTIWRSKLHIQSKLIKINVFKHTSRGITHCYWQKSLVWMC